MKRLHAIRFQEVTEDLVSVAELNLLCKPVIKVIPERIVFWR